MNHDLADSKKDEDNCAMKTKKSRKLNLTTPEARRVTSLSVPWNIVSTKNRNVVTH